MGEKIPEILAHFRDFRKERGDEDANKNVSMDVAEIQFAYNNHALMSLLKTRGTAIRDLDFDTLEATNIEIDKMVKDESRYKDLTRPVCAFITFENDDAALEAIKYSKKKSWY